MKILVQCVAYTLVLVLLSCTNKTDKPVSSLEVAFLNPPIEAKPRALWDWVNGNYDLKKITYELEEVKKQGMGGMDIWDISSVVDEDSVVPAGPAFMSDDYVKAIVHAINEATRLGLDLGIITASGWNSGGNWTKSEYATMGLYETNYQVSGPGVKNFQMPFPNMEMLSKNKFDTLLIRMDKSGKPIYYRDIKVLAMPEGKTSFLKNEVIDITDKMDSLGNISWNVPKGKWKIIRYVCTNTGQPMFSCTPNSVGPMIDHFNPDATVAHIEYFTSRLLKHLGSFEGKSLKYLYSDSYEVKGLLWTEKMLEEFKKRFGYEMDLYIPALYGNIVENEEITSRFLYDFRKLLSDLIIENHYVKAKEICNKYGLKYAAEAAGPGAPLHNCPFESLKSSGSLDIPRGEFWHKTSGRKGDDILQVIKGVASASHIYNQKFVEAEAFTSVWLWQEGPGELKPTLDKALCEGLNRVIFHTFPHVPERAGNPGWVYSFGTLVNTTRIWWPKVKPFMDYTARCSYMLQQGNFVGDVLFYYGDSTPNFVNPKKLGVSVPYGYDYDYANSDIIINKLDVKDAKLVLPHGQSYEVFVLPNVSYMDENVINKIESLVSKGAWIIGPRPTRSHGLANYKKRDASVRAMADKIWGNIDGKKITENTYGKGKIFYGVSLENVLKLKNVLPDFIAPHTDSTYTADYIHRNIDGTDIYFISNICNKDTSFYASFRNTSLVPELWHPDKAYICKDVLYKKTATHTSVYLSLQANESVFVVFKDKTGNAAIETLKYNGLVLSEDNKADIAWPHIQYSDKNITYKTTGEYEITKTDKNVFKVSSNNKSILVDGAWDVYFEKNKKAPEMATFDSLYSYSVSTIDGIKYFSGIAKYQKSISIKKNNDSKVEIDLGIVEVVAHVFVNKKDAGIIWGFPFKADITNFIVEGDNIIEIEIANTWINRLIGDSYLPKQDRITNTNITRTPNAWMYKFKDLPDSNYPLRSGGLLGPVTIITTRNVAK